MANRISNTDDLIDSLDVVNRIDELEAMTAQERGEEDQCELEVLKNLADQGVSFEDGYTLVHEDYFAKHTKEMAGDTIPVNFSAWPVNCIDWDKAADELRHDYTSLDFDGVEYLVRA